MNSIKEKLTNMFEKVMAGTVTREEGTMLLNHLVREDPAGTVAELALLIENPPAGVFPKTIIHTIALARNKAFYEIMIESLAHKSEDVSVLAAEELARLRTNEAREVLSEHLNSEIEHVRKASAAALVQGFSEGPELVKQHMAGHADPFYRLTSAQGLLLGGKKGVSALLNMLATGTGGVIVTAAEALMTAPDKLEDSDIPGVFEALMNAGDRKDAQSAIELLKVAGSLNGRAKGFESFIQAFADYPFEAVKVEAERALRNIRS